MTITMTFEVETPADYDAVMEYVEEAIDAHKGGLDPRDEMFDAQFVITEAFREEDR